MSSCSKNGDQTVTELVAWTQSGSYPGPDPHPSQGGSFSNWIHAASNETSADTGTAPALFEGWRSGNLVCKSPSQPNSGGDTTYKGGSR